MPSLVKRSAVATVMAAGLMAASTTVLPASYEDVGYSLVPAVNFNVGTSPFAVAVGDFNGDSKPDIAAANQDSNNVSVRLGTGTGSFGAATNFAAGSGPQGLATADFNGDGKLDLAVANITSNNVSILLGTGAGTFGSASQFATGANPRSVAVGDFNKDGKLDLAVPNGSGPLAILLGNGNGSFGAATNFGVGPNPNVAAIGDFNGDTNLDIAVTNEGNNTLTILLGAGNGTFTVRATRAVGSQPRSVVTADFNGDGRKDLAVANLGSNNVSVLIGVGNGDFGAVVNFAAGTSPTAVIARDLNADGKLELIIANEADRMTVLLGTGTGSFGVPASFVAGLGPRWVEAADFNRDGHLDLVVANQRGNNVSVLMGEVLPVLQVNPSQKPNDTSSYALRRTSIWVERQDLLSTGLFSHAMYADINKDGFVDFVRTHETNDGIRRPLQVMMGGPGSTFTDATATVITNTQPGLLVTRKILTADFNGDGWPDFFLLNHGLDIPSAPGEYPQLFLSNGNGTLRYVPGLEGPQFTLFNHGGAAADIDGNGTVDVLVANPTSPFFLINDGTGRFTKNTNRLPLALIGAPFYTAELIDVDNDGFMDLLSGCGEAGLPTTIYWGSSSGYYRGSNSTVLPPVASWGIVLDFAAEDIDRDGRKDLVINRTGSGVADYQGRYFQILRQTASRAFVDQTGIRMFMDTSLRWIDFLRAQDINGDGAVDLLLDDKSDMAIGEHAWINNGAGVFHPYTGAVAPTIPRHSRGDFNSDAKSDVLWRNQSTGSNVIWKSANASTPQSVTGVGLAWKIVGLGDFEGDGRADILWRNGGTGANAIWKSGKSATSQAVASLAGSAWQVAGVGEFNGDGKGDIVWRNQSTGANMIWKSGNAATSQAMTGVTNLAWEIVGVGDFNYDGISDVLWRNSNTGANTIWKSAQSSSWQTVTGVTNLAWKVAGVGDFDGDGASDILWRNQTTGANVIWKSAKSSSPQTVAGMTDLAWKIVAVGDYDSDGKSDILWRNSTTGANVIWRSGNSAKSQAVTGVTNLAWTIVP